MISKDKKYLSGLLKSVEKPGRYTGGEFGQIIKDKSQIKLRFAFGFPDTYEIGMSNLGVRILYGLMNTQPDIWCERFYAPWIDMEEKMRALGLPLCAHESGDPVCEFDMIGYTLQYELSYSNVLNLLSLAGLPLHSDERDDTMPLVIGGGPCTYNAEPIADFFDLFLIGEGEESLVELCRLYIEMKQEGGYTKEAFLRRAVAIEGCYVPSFYQVTYGEDKKITSIRPTVPEAPAKAKKRIVRDMDTAYFPDQLVMPFIETVHDRIMLEVYRGCIRGCRFCQAGMVYRPVREKSPNVLCEQAMRLFEKTGYDEISLSSLSISDYSRIDTLTDMMLAFTEDKKINLSLPSLRVDSFTRELMDKVSSVRTGGLTFAPEAGSQRLRDVINKNVTEEDLLRAVNVAFEAGKNSVKLYFMQGLPTETFEDLDGIADLAKEVINNFYNNPKRNKARPPSVTVSVSCFVPKAFTPFQWEAQDSLELCVEKQQYLGSRITDRKIRYNYHDAKVSRLEAVFARGDRRLAPALVLACRRGLRFDAWSECFDYEAWMKVFEDCGIDPDYYANREIGVDEILPWDVIDCGVDKTFLLRERELAYKGATTPSCKEKCSACGANRLGGEMKWCPKSKKI